MTDARRLEELKAFLEKRLEEAQMVDFSLQQSEYDEGQETAFEDTLEFLEELMERD